MEANWNIPITDPSQVGEARRIATAFASSLMFDETESGKIALVTTEISSNIIRHAKEGEILMRSVQGESGTAIELIGIDHGPGMGNLNLCMEDGFSTSGTSGIGLGGIKRLSDVFEIDSTLGRGTTVLSRIYHKKSPYPARQESYYDWGAIAVPYPNEQVSGDAYSIVVDQEIATLLVVDGLGHGPLAAEPAQRAVRIFQECGHDELENILIRIHDGLRGTRGAAVGIARILPAKRELQFIGVGNISGSILNPQGSSKSVMSFAGIVGQEMRKAKIMNYAWPEMSQLVMHSDGLQSQWDASLYPRSLRADAPLLAGTLYRDFNRRRDDVTVVVIKARSRRSPSWM